MAGAARPRGLQAGLASLLEGHELLASLLSASLLLQLRLLCEPLEAIRRRGSDRLTVETRNG